MAKKPMISTMTLGDIAEAMKAKMFEMRHPMHLSEVACIISILKAKIIEDAREGHHIHKDREDQEMLSRILASQL